MASYLTPGVYVKERLADKPIQGVSTSVGGFIGIVPRGIRNKAVMVSSWPDFINKFAYGLSSPFLANSYLSYSLFGFFLNGGTRAYVVGVASDSLEEASFTYKDEDEGDILTISAIDGGTWGNDLSITLTKNDSGDRYDFSVFYKEEMITTYKNVSLLSTSSRFIENIVNGVDKFIKVEVKSVEKDFVDDDLGAKKALAGGIDGTADLADDDFTSAVSAFDYVDDLNILVVPDSQSTAVIAHCNSYVEGRGDCIFLIDAPENTDKDDIVTFRNGITQTSYGALYYPWIKVSDPIGVTADKTKFIPVAGHIAGMMARTDSNRSVYKAPAGIIDGRLFGVLDVKYHVTDAEQETMNPIGINVIRSFKNEGIITWGARMLDNTYINIRRGLNYIKKSLKNNMRWVVYEPNNERLWNRITTVIRSFLLSEYNNNREGFKGSTPEESFFVKCDGELNTPEIVQLGQVKMQVGVAIAEPGEFVIIEVGQWEGGSSAQEL